MNAAHTMQAEHLPRVSVIIPVFNDADRLMLCLQALEKQTYPQGLLEVIVVDNGSDQSIEPLVTQFARAKACVERKPGSYAARNQGVSRARGEVLAFVDSDCIPASDWLEQGVRALLSSPNAGLVGGKVEFLFRDPAKPNAIELFDSLTAFQQKEYIQVAKFSGAGNLFTFRGVLEHVGLFNDTLKSGGDFEWSRRVFEQGYQLIYADEARVAHPARYRFDQVSRKYLRVVAGEYAIRCEKGYSFSSFSSDLLQNLLLPLRWAPRLLGRPGITPVQKVKVLWVMFVVRLLQAGERVRLWFGAESSLR